MFYDFFKSFLPLRCSEVLAFFHELEKRRMFFLKRLEKLLTFQSFKDILYRIVFAARCSKVGA